MGQPQRVNSEMIIHGLGGTSLLGLAAPRCEANAWELLLQMTVQVSGVSYVSLDQEGTGKPLTIDALVVLTAGTSRSQLKNSLLKALCSRSFLSSSSRDYSPV